MAELGSFNKATEKLIITQTALTRGGQKLETFAGARLINRTPRATALTQMGRDGRYQQPPGYQQIYQQIRW